MSERYIRAHAELRALADLMERDGLVRRDYVNRLRAALSPAPTNEEES